MHCLRFSTPPPPHSRKNFGCATGCLLLRDLTIDEVSRPQEMTALPYFRDYLRKDSVTCLKTRMTCNTAVRTANLAIPDVFVVRVSYLSEVQICFSTIRTLPNSSSERVPNGPTESLAGRWALMMMRTFEICTGTGSLNHPLM
jgi:hypothetical protein